VCPQVRTVHEWRRGSINHPTDKDHDVRKPLLIAVAMATLTIPVSASTASTNQDSVAERRTPRAELLYTFDNRESLQADTRLLDSAGPYRDNGWVKTANGGRLVPRRHGAGRAVGFPSPCPDPGCPRAIISTPHRKALNPGIRPFSFGAQIRLSPNRTAFTSTIIRKGDFPTAGRWRLRVDRAEGFPYCAVSGTAGTVVMRSLAGIADGQWHTVRCARRGPTLRLIVDGTIVRTKVGPIGVVRNAHPVLIGGTSTRVRNNQFSGTLDNVHLRIRRP
jgi:hypothetical protein